MSSKPPAFDNKVVIAGQDGQTLATIIDNLATSGISFAIVDTIAEAHTLAANAESPIELVVVDQPLADRDLIDLADLINAHILKGWTHNTIYQISGSNPQIESDLRRAGARHVLGPNPDGGDIRQQISTALNGDDRSGAIRDFISRHKPAVGRMMASVFEITSHDQAEKLATMLASHYPDPELVSTGIWELLANAIEHGNLGITCEEKTALLLSGELTAEIARRSRRPPFCDRFVRVDFRRRTDRIVLTIADQGEGFDFQAYLGDEISTDRPNGRGIFIANKFCFHKLNYKGSGNKVEAVFKL